MAEWLPEGIKPDSPPQQNQGLIGTLAGVLCLHGVSSPSPSSQHLYLARTGARLCEPYTVRRQGLRNHGVQLGTGQPRDVLALLRRARIGSESHGVEVAFLVPSLP